MTLRKRMLDDHWPYYDLGAKGLRLDVDEILNLTRRPKGRDEVTRKPRKSAKLTGGRRGVKKLESRAVNE